MQYFKKSNPKVRTKKILSPVFLALALAMLLGCATGSENKVSSDGNTVPGASSASAIPSNAPPSKALAPRQRTDTPPKPDITCTKASDTRLLEIEEVKSGCWLFYVNKEIKKRSAWSKNGNAHCEKVRDQIRNSLEKAGYKCQWVQ